jgi:hypothetical protein
MKTEEKYKETHVTMSMFVAEINKHLQSTHYRYFSHFKVCLIWIQIGLEQFVFTVKGNSHDLPMSKCKILKIVSPN